MDDCRSESTGVLSSTRFIVVLGVFISIVLDPATWLNVELSRGFFCLMLLLAYIPLPKTFVAASAVSQADARFPLLLLDTCGEGLKFIELPVLQVGVDDEDVSKCDCSTFELMCCWKDAPLIGRDLGGSVCCLRRGYIYSSLPRAKEVELS
jgi:hypothetical protein